MDVGGDYFALDSTAYCFLGMQNSVAYLDGKISGTSVCFVVLILHYSVMFCILCYFSLHCNFML